MSVITYRPFTQFHLTEGGPTYRLEKRVGLIRENLSKARVRAFLPILVTWVPLLVLSAVEGNAKGNHIPIPFLHDFAVHTRFLLAVPLLLLAETILGVRLAHVAAHFIESGLVIESDYNEYESAIQKGLRWRDSALAEFLLIVIAFALTTASQLSPEMQISSWHFMRKPSGDSLTAAGWWYTIFCVPLYRFLLLRWLWRVFLWGQFLWRMNRLNLQLMPTHPDESGGLAFVGEEERFFSILLFANSVTAAGVLANSIIYDKVPLQHYWPLIAAYVVISVLTIMLPLLVFSSTLVRVKRWGRHQYGALGTEYTSAFQKKWVTGPRDPEEVLLGTGDIQSLADLGNSFSFIEKMDVIPVGPRTPISLAIACLIPFVPLLLTMMSLGDILKALLKMIL